MTKEYLSEAKASTNAETLASNTRRVLPTAFDQSYPGDFSYADIRFTPFLETKSVQAGALVRSRESSRAYHVVVNFYNVQENEKPSYRKNPVRVSCSCDSYYFWFSYANQINDVHAGSKMKTYVPVPDSERKRAPGPPKNPTNTPGACKHILALLRYFSDTGKID